MTHDPQQPAPGTTWGSFRAGVARESAFVEAPAFWRPAARSRAGSVRATFDTQLTSAMRQVGGARPRSLIAPGQLPFLDCGDRHVLRSAGFCSHDAAYKRVRAPWRGDSGAKNGRIRRKNAKSLDPFIDFSMAWLGPTRVSRFNCPGAAVPGRRHGNSTAKL